ncbi:hypothetical protein N7509_005491 [Penicillium cosmopolitanum]|uniref:Uncharacterized protein n=1 Tax=Penicillium cosmopolitanum TaxID=1131564 RepID=A0A9W9W2L8_9EURO|nr:uncharacterized protein N7509_005491 [Penicillium cosmopolitanum]KAJ5397378.1 hypothetical protein N7509_005491 [Penicillium cosmopolitanum]
MQFKSLLVTSLMAISAVAANNGSDIAPSVQGRIAQLDLGFKQTDVMLNKLKNNIGGITADDIVVAYREVVAREATDMMMPQPWKALEDSQQMVICQSFHSVKSTPKLKESIQLQSKIPNNILLQLALTGLDLNADFTFSANYFNQTQRHDLQHNLNKVTEETSDFVKNVAKTAVPYCLDIIQEDNKAIYKSIRDARQALSA